MITDAARAELLAARSTERRRERGGSRSGLKVRTERRVAGRPVRSLNLEATPCAELAPQRYSMACASVAGIQGSDRHLSGFTTLPWKMTRITRRLAIPSRDCKDEFTAVEPPQKHLAPRWSLQVVTNSTRRVPGKHHVVCSNHTSYDANER